MNFTSLPITTGAARILIPMIEEEGTATPKVVALIARDPALVYLVIKAANQFKLDTGSPPEVCSIAQAVVTLGVEQLKNLLVTEMQRPHDLSEAVFHHLQWTAEQALRAAHIATTLAASVFPNAIDDVQILGYANYLGDLVSILTFKEDLLKLVEKHEKRTKVRYYLEKDYGFDFDDVTRRYLRESLIPKTRSDLLHPNTEVVSTDSLRIRTIVQAGGELLEAWNSNRFDVYAPGKNLPSRSVLRGIKFSDAQYKELYQTLTKMLTTELTPCPMEPESAVLEEDSKEEQEESQAFLQIEPDDDGESALELSMEEGQVILVASEQPEESATHVTPPTPRAQCGFSDFDAIMAPFEEVFRTVEDSETLVLECLDEFIVEGTFKRAAVLAIDQSNEQLLCLREASVFTDEQHFVPDLVGELRFGKKAARVRSFALNEKSRSPWGSRAYALGPLNLENQSFPAMLYVDCGDELFVPFTARKFFRTVLSRMNEVLPELEVVPLLAEAPEPKKSE